MTEEFVFRACIIAILHEAGYSIKHLIYVSPLYFGIAHLHHAWGNYKQWGGTARALRNALLSSTFQFAYTTVFGWYASYLFVRTGNVWSPVLCHSFCNYMGFPELNNINHRPLLHRIGNNR
jgi:prenyl protein peptidase